MQGRYWDGKKVEGWKEGRGMEGSYRDGRKVEGWKEGGWMEVR